MRPEHRCCSFTNFQYDHTATHAVCPGDASWCFDLFLQRQYLHPPPPPAARAPPSPLRERHTSLFPILPLPPSTSLSANFLVFVSPFSCLICLLSLLSCLVFIGVCQKTYPFFSNYQHESGAGNNCSLTSLRLPQETRPWCRNPNSHLKRSCNALLCLCDETRPSFRNRAGRMQDELSDLSSRL